MMIDEHTLNVVQAAMKISHRLREEGKSEDSAVVALCAGMLAGSSSRLNADDEEGWQPWPDIDPDPLGPEAARGLQGVDTRQRSGRARYGMDPESVIWADAADPVTAWRFSRGRR